MNIVDKHKIITTWTNEVEDITCKGMMHIYFDKEHFELNSCNSQCIIDVWRNKLYIASYTHIESCVFDIDKMYTPIQYKTCVVKVSKKRKRDE
jgi:hypothetical protein